MHAESVFCIADNNVTTVKTRLMMKLQVNNWSVSMRVSSETSKSYRMQVDSILAVISTFSMRSGNRFRTLMQFNTYNNMHCLCQC